MGDYRNSHLFLMLIKRFILKLFRYNTDMTEKIDLVKKLQSNEDISFKERMSIVYNLSIPSILAQVSEIVMQYIDAAMVGVLGAQASAAIGLVSTSTWLFGGIIAGVTMGFSVQVAQAIGSGKEDRSRRIFKESILASFLMSVVFGFVGAMVSSSLPRWLGADVSLWKDATDYFLFFALFLPARMLQRLGVTMFQCIGNMKISSIFSGLMCLLDVIFNYFLIFPSRRISFFGIEIWMPGAGLGVLGAQLGTSFAVVVCMVLCLWYAAVKEEGLCLKGVHGSWLPSKEVMRDAFRIGFPMVLEQTATTGAQVVSTRIVAPLGTVAIAANSFAVTAESICYMPGFGVANAATTMVGQAVGARRKDMANSFAWLTTFTGMVIMSLTAIVMFFLCPYIFAFLTPDLEVQVLGVEVLRIELFAEPFFAASIVATGALRGAGDTLVPGVMNLVSIWGVRITLAFVLTKVIGLNGAWIAMALELTVRGILFLIRLKRGKWLETIN